MTAKIICMASVKGGSGKTSLTASFGTFLAALGKKVLLIDTDSATHGLTLLYIKEVMEHGKVVAGEGRKPKGVYGAIAPDDNIDCFKLNCEASGELLKLPDDFKIAEDLKNKIRYDDSLKRLLFEGLMSKEEKDELLKLSQDAPYKEAIEALFKRSQSGVHLLPATYEFVDIKDISPEDYKSSLSNILSKVRDSFDYIFLDAQAGSDFNPQFAMSRGISDEVIIVSEYDPMSAAGVERLKGLLRDDLTYERTWILLNKMLPEFAQSYSDFFEVTKYLSPIPWDADVVRAYARRRLALDLDHGNEYTLAIIQTLKGLLGESVSKGIELWAEERASTIRQPIEDQYKDAEKELEGLFRQRAGLIRLSDLDKITLSIFIGASIFLFLYYTPLRYLIFNFIGSRHVLALPFSVLAILLFILASALLVFRVYVLKVKGFYVNTKLAQARLDRQKAILEERLKKLEILRSADLETLLKSKRQV